MEIKTYTKPTGDTDVIETLHFDGSKFMGRNLVAPPCRTFHVSPSCVSTIGGSIGGSIFEVGGAAVDVATDFSTFGLGFSGMMGGNC